MQIVGNLNLTIDFFQVGHEEEKRIMARKRMNLIKVVVKHFKHGYRI
jgi:hypothetical protein